jgi:hypothetical protein
VSWLSAEGDSYIALFEPVTLFLLPATPAFSPESTYKAPLLSGGAVIPCPPIVQICPGSVEIPPSLCLR